MYLTNEVPLPLGCAYDTKWDEKSSTHDVLAAPEVPALKSENMVKIYDIMYVMLSSKPHGGSCRM